LLHESTVSDTPRGRLAVSTALLPIVKYTERYVRRMCEGIDAHICSNPHLVAWMQGYGFCQ
jgi:hypothetical protein